MIYFDIKKKWYSKILIKYCIGRKQKRMCKYWGFYIKNLNLIAKYKQKILIDTKKKKHY